MMHAVMKHQSEKKSMKYYSKAKLLMWCLDFIRWFRGKNKQKTNNKRKPFSQNPHFKYDAFLSLNPAMKVTDLC